MDNYNQQFIIYTIIILLGYLLKRIDILTEKDGEILTKVVFNLTLPCLIIFSFNDVTFEVSLLSLTVIGFIYGLLMSFLFYLFFKKYNRSTKGALVMLAGGLNIGLFAYPLVEGIFGSANIKYFIMLDIGNVFHIFVTSYIIGSLISNSKVTVKESFFQSFKSIPLLTYFLVFIINILNIELPAVILNTTEIISKANMPLSLLILGIFLSFTFDKQTISVISKFLVLRYTIGILCGTVMYFVLPFDPMFKMTLLIGLILPTATIYIVYAIKFKFNTKIVGAISSFSVILSFALTWLIMLIV